MTIPEDQLKRSVAAGKTDLEIAFTASEGCAWTVSVAGEFLSVTETSGTGAGVLHVSAAANAGASRTGTITINSAQLTVEQAAAPCTASIAPATITVPAAGGTGTIPVTARDGCQWKAQINGAFISSPVHAGTGSGAVSYSVPENVTLTPRQGTITIDDKSVTVSQAASPRVAPPPPPGATTYLTFRSDANDSITHGAMAVITAATAKFTVSAGSTEALTYSISILATAGGQTFEVSFFRGQGQVLRPGVYEGAVFPVNSTPPGLIFRAYGGGCPDQLTGRFEIYEETFDAYGLKRFRASFEHRCLRDAQGQGVVGEVAYTAPDPPGPIIPPPAPAGAATYLTLQWAGASPRVDVPPASFAAVTILNYLIITIRGVDGFKTSVELRAMTGDSLHVGAFENARDTVTGGGGDRPGLMVQPNRFCTSNGRFQIDELIWDGKTVTRLKVRFEQECDDYYAGQKLVGELSLTAPF